MTSEPSRTQSATVATFYSRLRSSLERFFEVETASGVVLLLLTLLALIWANSPWSAAYEGFWHIPVRLALGDRAWETTPRFVVNDGLMSLFFLLVGLEIRSELRDGQLGNARRALIPVMAAAGGVVMPALIYFALTTGELRRGWAIPTATDIAFAIGVLTLLGRRIPAAVRVLLLSLAVIDDLAAVVIIALFYSGGIAWQGMLVAAAGVGLVLLFQRLAIRSALTYALPGAVVWSGLLRAGVHPTLAGVVLGLLTPAVTPAVSERLLRALGGTLREMRARIGENGALRKPHELARIVKRLRHARRELVPPITRVQRALHPWVAFGVMPLFAFANAGVSLRPPRGDTEPAETLTWAIVIALVCGKPLGIMAFTWVSARIGLVEVSEHLSWRGVLLVGCLGGVGFTMSLFLTNLSFGDAALITAGKSAVLLGSAIAATGGYLLGRFVLFRQSPTPRE